MTVRILLIEDDCDVRTTMEHSLLGEGYAVDVATTVAAACALVESRTYDLVLVDVMLPDGRGVRVTDCAAERGVKVLIVTRYGFRIPAAHLDRYDFVVKPLRRAELLSEVERRIGAHAP